MAVNPQVEAVREAVGALNRGDVEGYLRAFTADCRRWLPGVPDPLSLVEIGASLEPVMAALDGFRLEEVLLFGDGRHVCARWRMVGTHSGNQLGIPATRRPVAVETAKIYEFEREDGGLVRASWCFADPMEMFRQLNSPAD